MSALSKSDDAFLILNNRKIQAIYLPACPPLQLLSVQSSFSERLDGPRDSSVAYISMAKRWVDASAADLLTYFLTYSLDHTRTHYTYIE